jgi:hypothetical protein
MTGDERITGLRAAADKTGLTIDFLDHLTTGLSSKALRRFIGNASETPSYMKSSDSPYVLRKDRAAASPI